MDGIGNGRRTAFAGISVLIVMLFSLMPSGVWAQSTAQISGNVSDQSGAVLPGVEVTVTQTETGISRSAVSNETGGFTLPSLPIGPYKLEAALPGFRTYAQTGIVLQVALNNPNFGKIQTAKEPRILQFALKYVF